MNEKIWIKYYEYLLNEQLTQKRIKKMHSSFNIVSRYLDFEKAKREDIERFVNELNQDKIKMLRGKGDYSAYAKRDFKKFLKQFYKWYKGEDGTYPREVIWIKTKIAKDDMPEERPVVELKDVIKIAKKFKKYDYQMMTLLLFDSGFRIQEMMSVKKKDLTWADFDDGKYCFWIKCNQSKTFIRNIPIPLFTEDINSYVNSAEFKSKNDNDSLFNFSYPAYTTALKEYSLQLIGKPLTCHCLRHSSATYYAREYSGNVPLLAQRYGWEYSAKELKTYVRSSGAYNKEGAKVSYKNEVSKLREENQKLIERMEKIEEQIKKFIDKQSDERIKAKG